jgi:predicted MFS family arabinose efflux permease
VPWAGASAGSVALAAGLLLIVAAASTDSSALLVTGSIIGGGGFGVAFLGALRALSGAIPPEHRAAVMSAFYVVGYLSISLPAVLAGVLVTPLGLEATFEIFASVLAGVALILAFEAWRTRPRPEPVTVELGYDVAR